MRIIWRDDDILHKPGQLAQLLAVDDIFKRFGQLHTVAIIAETLTPEIGNAIRERGMSPQLHCWSHDDLSVSDPAVRQLPQAVDIITEMVGVRPRVLYPPWNRISLSLLAAANDLGLAVSWKKISLEQYIRCRGDVEEQVINLHYWHQPDVDLLPIAMQIHAQSVGASSSAAP